MRRLEQTLVCLYVNDNVFKNFIFLYLYRYISITFKYQPEYKQFMETSCKCTLSNKLLHL
jgi:hypothetical protein